MLIRQHALELRRSILMDEGWKQLSDHTFGTDNLKIWTANGFWFIDFYPGMQAFNIFEKILIHYAIASRKIKDANIKIDKEVKRAV